MSNPSDTLKKALQEKPCDRISVIASLTSNIIYDPEFRTNDFKDAVKYALSHGISEAELFEPFNSEYEIISDKSKWNYDYYCEARNYLDINFCNERIKHVEEVAHYLYPPKPAEKQQSETNNNGGNGENFTKRRHKKINQKLLVAAVIAAAGIIITMIIKIITN